MDWKPRICRQVPLFFDNDEKAGRPMLIRGGRQLLFAGMSRLIESSLLNVKNKSHTWPGFPRAARANSVPPPPAIM